MSRLSASAMPQWLKYWLAWTAAGLFYISQDFITRLSHNESIPWRNVVIGWMAAMYICALFTPLICRSAAAVLWTRVSAGSAWGIHFAGLGGSSRWHQPPWKCRFWRRLECSRHFGIPPRSGADFWDLLPYDLHGGIVRYWAVIGLQALFRSNREARRREREALELKVQSSQLAEQLTAAHLSALKMQMHPHFLFNTLSAIMVLVRQGKEKAAETMLSRLSDLLRHTLDNVDAPGGPAVARTRFSAAISFDRAGSL